MPLLLLASWRSSCAYARVRTRFSGLPGQEIWAARRLLGAPGRCGAASHGPVPSLARAGRRRRLPRPSCDRLSKSIDAALAPVGSNNVASLSVNSREGRRRPDEAARLFCWACRHATERRFPRTTFHQHSNGTAGSIGAWFGRPPVESCASGGRLALALAVRGRGMI